MIEIDKDTILLWYLEQAPAFNVLGAIKRAEPGTLQIVYRFRYDGTDPRPFEGNDRKNWYAFKTRLPENLAVEKTLAPFRLMAAKLGRPLEFIRMRNGDVDAFMASKPWSHMRVEKA